MSYTHFVKERGSGPLDVVENLISGVRITIRRKGAEMISLERMRADGTWQGFLYRDGVDTPPSSGWANHATVMGYFLHRLVNEQSNYEGSVIHGGNHGFLRSFDFPAPTFDSGTGTLTYRVATDRIPPDAYPRPVAMALSYTLTGNGVRIQFCFTNESTDRPSHVSFGIHPGFQIDSLSSARIVVPHGRYIRYFAPGNFLNGETEVVDWSGDGMPFDRSKLEESYLLGISEIPNRIIRLESGDRRVELDFSEVPFMTLWSSADNFVCIEPCWGLPDSIPQKPFAEKIGIQTIDPGKSLTAGFKISAELESPVN